MTVPPQPTIAGPPLTTTPSPTEPRPAQTAAVLTAQWGLYKTQRLALLVIATLLQQHQYSLLMHLVQNGGGVRDGGLSQSLLELVDSVTRGDSGGRPIVS